jgi:hypothetical protein
MDIKLVSKNNMGIVITLILVILLSQSRFFDFLTDTPQGRIILLALIVLIAYTNKILGLLAVLFVIIAFNQNDISVVQSYNFYEGFDGSGNSTDSTIMKDKLTQDKAKEDILKKKMPVLNADGNSSQTTTTSSSAASESFGGREGFCMSDRELNILRGKQSSTVPVFNKSREQTNEVDPTDKSVFSDSYASF